VVFVIVHIYLSFYHDYIEGRGTVSSIIGGWKFDRETSPEEAAAESKLQEKPTEGTKK
jgi:Ni/Fe-hydrogenase 1 B-type cytochrome subunit